MLPVSAWQIIIDNQKDEADLIEQYRLDPYDHMQLSKKPNQNPKASLEKINHYFPLENQSYRQDIDRICKALHMDGKVLIPKHKNLLADMLLTINLIGGHLPVPGQKKPFLYQTMHELLTLKQTVVARIKKARGFSLSDQIVYLSIQREILRRTTGFQAMSVQLMPTIIMMMSTVDLLYEIKAGQGKSITLALMQAYSLDIKADRAKRFKLSSSHYLNERDYKDFSAFFSTLFHSDAGMHSKSLPADTEEVEFMMAGSQPDSYQKASLIMTSLSDLFFCFQRAERTEETECRKG